MKRLRIIVGIIIVIVLVIIVGMLLYKYFITDQIKDKDGMINPQYLIDLDNAPIADSIEKENTQ